MTYYDVLEIKPDAKLIDIKKAYRRLALQWHPDRNKGSHESTERFKEIGEAYQVLSDNEKRAAYDSELRYDAQQSQRSTQQPQQTYSRHHQHRPYVDSRGQYARRPSDWSSSYPHARRRRQRPSMDPFAQFDNLFRNDSFFQEAFKDMDDEFAKRFSHTRNNYGPAAAAAARKRRSEGWLTWLLRQCGIEFHMTTVRSNGNGVFTSSTLSSNRNSYQDRTTRTFVDSRGRKVMVSSIEKDGNRIEDTYVGTKLVQRKVNDVPEPLEKVVSHEANSAL